MLEHDFYADPTVFDQLKSEAAGWLCTRLEKLCPYAWTIGFSLLGLVFLSIATGVFAVLLLQRFGGEPASVLNQSLAQAVTMMIALLAAQVVFKQALAAWPRQVEMPVRLRFLMRFFGFSVPSWRRQRAAHQEVRRIRPDRRRTPASEQQAIQDFFAGVRAAGVNVTIARTLFAAGIRSVDRLCTISDRQLQAIRGVGPATVRKLRKHFPAR
ncbi:MAG TPA: helix-hairpin-helix domain-containing protein [Gammaproteobacteria bacterium]|nr:helix-hairpin-helix domain-containing protein [Gammaproteobacteria bacterium]